MASLWQDALHDVGQSCLHFREALTMFEEADFAPDGQPSYRAKMAFLHAMEAGYTSFEAALKRLLAMLDEALPVGADWHSVLVRRVSKPLEGSRPAILGPAIADAVFELMRFRHVAMHSYDYFDLEKAARTVREVRVFLARIDEEIATFRAVIDPPAA